MLKTTILVTSAVIIAGFRISGEKGIFYQAIAHFFVGGMFFGCYESQDERLKQIYRSLALGLTAVEVTMFLIGRYQPFINYLITEWKLSI